MEGWGKETQCPGQKHAGKTCKQTTPAQTTAKMRPRANCFTTAGWRHARRYIPCCLPNGRWLF
eukprot:1966519-Lingulodinium_polyedra.AAC.1